MPDSIRSLLPERMRRLRRKTAEPPTNAAIRPKGPQDTAVIGSSSKTVSAASRG